MNGAVVVDTHTAIWYLLESDQLSRALATLDAAAEKGEPVFVASISLVETVYLVEKGKLPRLGLERLYTALIDPDTGFLLVPLDHAVARC